ncbi:MAG: type II toxin-antitoxin system RatA family toxin [Pseudomonadota bacterium]
MTQINRSALLPYTAEQMFALVDDVSSYAEFLPWCRSATELERDEEQVVGQLELAYGSIHKSFTTRNLLHHPTLIEMRLVDGPFKQLEGFWRFDPLGEDGCRTTLDLSFDFSSRVVGMAMGPIFSQVANSLVDSFSKRAEVVYGG